MLGQAVRPLSGFKIANVSKDAAIAVATACALGGAIATGCSVIVITDTVLVQLCPSAVVHGAAPGLAISVAVATAPLSAAAASAVRSAAATTAAARAGCLPPPLSGVESCPLLHHLGPALLRLPGR
jgi:hypothetical protein